MPASWELEGIKTMKAVKFSEILTGIALGFVLLGIAVGVALAWELVGASQAPAWAILSTLTICVAVFHATNGIKRDLARIQCELTGHWHAEFKKKHDDKAHCQRCKDVIRTRAPESDGPGMQFGKDTLHQRVSRLEAALGVHLTQFVKIIKNPSVITFLQSVPRLV